MRVIRERVCLVGQLTDKGKPLPGTRLNWVHMPLGIRRRPMRGIRQGETYEMYVERAHRELQEREECLQKKRNEPRFRRIGRDASKVSQAPLEKRGKHWRKVPPGFIHGRMFRRHLPGYSDIVELYGGY